MAARTPVFESNISQLTLLARGKVRDIYAIDDAHLAIVATDRLSAYDVILPNSFPGKGIILTQISRFWFSQLEDIVPHHLTPLSLTDVAGDTPENRALEARTMIVRRLQPLPMEAIARGYLIGSGWRDYQRTGSVCGHPLPSGLAQAAALDAPLFTPATKAEVGDHDENIDFETLSDIIGQDRAEHVRDITLRIYQRGADHAKRRGIIIADTKLEFGCDTHGKLILIDEVLTPDSSRFWPQAEYAPGTSPPSFDKQFVRDYLDSLDWDHSPPAPSLPESVIEGTRARYQNALDLLTQPGR